MKKGSKLVCRSCGQKKAESIDNLVSGCPILTLIEYKEKHDKIRHCIPWKVRKYYRVLDCER